MDLDTADKWSCLSRDVAQKRARRLSNLGWSRSGHCPIKSFRLDRQKFADGDQESLADYKLYLQRVMGYSDAVPAALDPDEPTFEEFQEFVKWYKQQQDFVKWRKQQGTKKRGLSSIAEEEANTVGTGPVDPEEGPPQKKPRN